MSETAGAGRATQIGENADLVLVFAQRWPLRPLPLSSFQPLNVILPPGGGSGGGGGGGRWARPAADDDVKRGGGADIGGQDLGGHGQIYDYLIVFVCVAESSRG
jgi:hypothetical protein